MKLKLNIELEAGSDELEQQVARLLGNVNATFPDASPSNGTAQKTTAKKASNGKPSKAATPEEKGDAAAKESEAANGKAKEESPSAETAAPQKSAAEMKQLIGGYLQRETAAGNKDSARKAVADALKKYGASSLPELDTDHFNDVLIELALSDD